MESDITLLLADDTLIARAGWRHILAEEPGLRVVGEALTAQAAVRLVQELQPDVLLLDLKWFEDESAGLGAIAALRRHGWAGKIIAVTVEPHLARPARRGGADAVLHKGFSKSELVSLIRTLVQAPAPFPAPVAPRRRARRGSAALAAGIGLPVLGFVLVTGVLLWGARSLSVPQFLAVTGASLLAFFFSVVFAAGYVRVLSPASTYKLLARLVASLWLRGPGGTRSRE